MDEALARLEREVAQDPSDEARLRALAAAKQRAGWTFAGHGLEHWVAQLSTVDVDARDHRTEEAFRAFGLAAVPLLVDAIVTGASEAASTALSVLGPRALLVAAPALRRVASTAGGERRRKALSALLTRHAAFEAMSDVFEGAVSDPDEEARLDALYFLELHQPTPPSALPHLIRGLRDPAALVRRHAARLLSRVVDPRVLQADVVEALLSQDVSCARAPDEPTFETVAGSDAIPAFLAATSSPDPLVRARAIRLLAVQQHGGHREAVAGRLCETLSDPDDDVRAEAFDALRHLVLRGLDPARLLPAVMAALHDRGPPDRRADALNALRDVGSAAVVVPVLLRALDDRDAGIRRAAALALAYRDEDARPAVPRLVALLDDPDEEVRRDAQHALERIHPGADQLPLIAQLLDRDDTRLLGAQLLAALGAPGVDLAPTALALLLAEPREDVRGFLADALLALGRSVEVALPHSRQNPDVLAEQLAALSRADPTIALALRRLLEHAAGATRVIAAHALGAAGTDEACLQPLLAHLAGAADPRERAEAAHALGRLRRGTPAVVSALTRALDDDPDVAYRAISALEALGGAARSAAAALTRAIASEDRSHTWAARRALDAVTRG